MTQPSRTTETINRDNAAIRDIMHQIRELTVPDRATLALGLVGHLAAMMNRAQMTKLMGQLHEEAERVQDVPPSRQHADEAVADSQAAELAAGAAGGGRAAQADRAAEDGRAAQADRAAGDGRAEERDRAARSDRGAQKDSRMATDRGRPTEARKRHGDVMEEHVVDSSGARRGAEDSRPGSHEPRQGVGQAGRGEFRSGRLL